MNEVSRVIDIMLLGAGGLALLTVGFVILTGYAILWYLRNR